MRYRLRTLLIVVVFGPPILAAGFHLYQEFAQPIPDCAHQTRGISWAEAVRQAKLVSKRGPGLIAEEKPIDP
jgi:hypothetical protein